MGERTMTTTKITGRWALALVAALAVGCGGSGGSSGGSALGGPSPEQKAPAQQANSGSSTVERTMDASNDAIVESGAPGATTAKTGATPSSTSGTTISFQATVNLT